MLMRQMRQNTKIIMLVTALAFVALMVFEWGMDASGRSGGGDLGRVGRTPVSPTVYQNTYRSIYDQVQRSQTQPISSAQNREIEDMAWDEVVNQLLIRSELVRRGIRVTDDEILEAAQFSPPPQFRTDPAFMNEQGQFDLMRYRQFLSQQGQDPAFLQQLEQYYRESIPREKLARQVTAGIFVSDRELWELYKDAREEVTVTALILDPAQRIPDSAVPVSREEVERHYNDNREDFWVPARAQVRYVYMDRLPSAADSLAAFDRALALRREILEGEAFGDVARRESADLSTAQTGGHMGFWGRGELLDEVEAVVFDLPVGELSEPVETFLGYHLLEVLSRDEDQVEARHILVEITLTDESEIRLLSRADSLEALAATRAFNDVAAQFGLEVLTGEISEDFAVLPGVGPALEGQDWIFEDQEGVGAVSPLFESMDAFYMLEIVRESPEGYLTLDEVASEIEGALRLERKRERLIADARDWAAELRDGRTSIEELGDRLSLPAVTEGPFTRLSMVPGLGVQSPAIGAAFGTAEGGIAGPVMAQGQVVLLRVDARTEADREAWEGQKELQRIQVTAQIQQERMGQWLVGLRETTRIVDGRAAFFRAAEEAQSGPQMPAFF